MNREMSDHCPNTMGR